MISRQQLPVVGIVRVQQRARMCLQNITVRGLEPPPETKRSAGCELSLLQSLHMFDMNPLCRRELGVDAAHERALDTAIEQNHLVYGISTLRRNREKQRLGELIVALGGDNLNGRIGTDRARKPSEQ